MKFNTNSVLRILGRVLSSALRRSMSQGSGRTRPRGTSGHSPSRPQAGGAAQRSAPAATGPGGSWEFGGYPGDYTGRVAANYAPKADGKPDPGEIVWAWVPYEEDHSQGKDRPVLLVGRDGNHLLALMLTSKDRNNAENRDRDYVDIGTGPWDKQGRPSEVKVDRVIRLDEAGIRREGAILDRDRFASVAGKL